MHSENLHTAAWPVQGTGSKTAPSRVISGMKSGKLVAIGRESSIRTVLEANPDIYNHNTETVPRLYKKCRPGGRYRLTHFARNTIRVGDLLPRHVTTPILAHIL